MRYRITWERLAPRPDPFSYGGDWEGLSVRVLGRPAGCAQRSNRNPDIARAAPDRAYGLGRAHEEEAQHTGEVAAPVLDESALRSSHQSPISAPSQARNFIRNSRTQLFLRECCSGLARVYPALRASAAGRSSTVSGRPAQRPVEERTPATLGL